MARTSASSRSRTAQQYSFSRAPSVGAPRSQYDRSHTVSDSFDAGWLVPILCDEVMPGDTANIRVTSFIRMATPKYPVLTSIFADYFWFFVPFRILWENFVRMMGERPDPADHINYSVPQFQGETIVEGSLSDHLGLPIGVTTDFNSWFHRAYNLIFREFFRDQDLTDSPVVDLDNGPDTLSDYVLRRRAKRHDYFTGCRPWVQKGDPVELPLGASAPITGTIAGAGDPTFDVGGAVADTLGSQVTTGYGIWSTTTTADPAATWNDPKLDASGLSADLSSATAATINEIREAFQIQRLLERDARGGTRYIEMVKSHFQVDSDDARHQRPEFLGGGTHRINMNPVATTAETTPKVGELGAFAVGAGQNGFVKSFTEHGVIMGLVSVRADLVYQQGIDKMFSRQTRYDFYLPVLQALGEQAVLNKEIYADGSANDDLTFGYQERWSEYRHKPSGVRGAMRSAAAAPLDKWHLALEFGSLPALNNTFIEDQPPIARVVLTPADPHFLADFGFEYKMARPMPTYSIPGMVDHF